MPHIIIKLWPGKTFEQKKELAEKFKIDMSEVLKVPKQAITLAYEEIKPEDWYDEVHIPIIEGNKTGEMFIPEGYKGYKFKT